MCEHRCLSVLGLDKLFHSNVLPLHTLVKLNKVSENTKQNFNVFEGVLKTGLKKKKKKKDFTNLAYH